MQPGQLKLFRIRIHLLFHPASHRKQSSFSHYNIFYLRPQTQQTASLWQRRYNTLQVHPAHLITMVLPRSTSTFSSFVLGAVLLTALFVIPSRQLSMFATTANIAPFLLMAVFVAQSGKAFPLEILSCLHSVEVLQ